MNNFTDRQSAFSTDALVINESNSGIAIFSGRISDMNAMSDMLLGDKFFTNEGLIFQYNGTKWKNITNNFSFKTVESNMELLIPEGQQMIVRRSIKILGTLRIEGDLWLAG